MRLIRCVEKIIMQGVIKMRLDNKVAIVTGVSGGLGSWVVLSLARAGAHAAVVANSNLKSGEVLTSQIQSEGLPEPLL